MSLPRARGRPQPNLSRRLSSSLLISQKTLAITSNLSCSAFSTNHELVRARRETAVGSKKVAAFEGNVCHSGQNHEFFVMRIRRNLPVFSCDPASKNDRIRQIRWGGATLWESTMETWMGSTVGFLASRSTEICGGYLLLETFERHSPRKAQARRAASPFIPGAKCVTNHPISPRVSLQGKSQSGSLPILALAHKPNNRPFGSDTGLGDT